jgi:hypothetical protein
MRKLDRLGWAAGISYIAYGRSYGIRTTDPSILDEVRELLPHGWKESGDEEVEVLYSLIVPRRSRPGLKRYHVLYNSSALVGRSFVRSDILEALRISTHAWAAEYARGAVFLHAGVVEWDGRAIIIPGRSYSGKSTLVAEFLRAGARYYSDEYAVLDERGRVRPFIKPISIRQVPSERPALHSPDAYGTSGSRPVPVGCVLLTNYKERARWRPRMLSPGEAILGVLDNTIAARRRPRAAITRIRKALANAVVLKGVRGEARDVVKKILANPPWEK